MAYGERWANEGRSLVLQVPSTVLSAEANYAVNPLHPSFGTLGVGSAEEVTLDARFLRYLAV